MDPSTRLDHAVFQLTPTRTRCDLLVSSGKGAYEKIASGLLEPFLSHLRCARDQIPKGGYSFALRPPAAAGRADGDVAAASPPWFTKGTLERFVGFVRNPDILERVTAIEKEIVHIETCIHPAAHEEEESSTSAATAQDTTANGTGKAEQQGSGSSHSSGEDTTRNTTGPPKVQDLRVEANGHDAARGENSKLCLQQILETRKAVLLKEQGMAYARAAVAGYEMVSIDDLVSFADAFGASRLREACMNFKDLCKKKERDKIWMDELAAMETCQRSEFSCSGAAIMLTTDHPELNGTFGGAVTDSAHAIFSSNVGQDNNGQPPNREPWTPATNGIHHEKPQTPVGWPSHPSQYMYNFQNPAQQMPPHGPYAFSGMVPPYYLGQFDNELQQSSCSDHAVHGDGYSYQRSYMSSSSNHSKPVKMKATRHMRTASEEKEGGETNDASSKSGSASDYEDSPKQNVHGKGGGHKRSNKKSSRTVVIRNINYISSDRRNEEDHSTDGSSVEGDINGDFLKQKVDTIVDSLEKYHKTSHRQHKKKGKNRNHKNVHGDEDSINKNVETDANAKVHNDTKGDESWQTFQSILMRDESSSTELHGENSIIPSKSNVQRQVFAGDDGHFISSPNLEAPLGHNFPLDAESPKGIRHRLVAIDPIAASAKDANYEDKGSSEIFDCDENYTTGMKRNHNADEELLFSERSKSVCVTPDDVATYGNELRVPNSHRDGDWFIVPKSGSLQDEEPTAEHSIFEGDQPLKSSNGASNEKTRNELLIDDSFVVATRSTADEHPISQWETDVSIMSGLAVTTEADVQASSHSTEHNRLPDNHEPDDLQMVLERSSEIEPVGASWTPELEYTADIAYKIVENFDSVLDANGSTDVQKPPTSKGAIDEVNPRNKLPGKDAKSRSLHGSLMKAKSEVMSRNKKSSVMSHEAIQRNKMLKEEENRKRIEDLLVQRQKRIAERSSNSSTSSSMSKVSSTESKLGIGSSKNEKKAPRSAIQGNNRSSVLTGSYKFG